MIYIDKKGVQIKEGDVLRYDEGDGGAKQLHEVVLLDGYLAGVTRVGAPEWSLVEDDTPIALRFYTGLADDTKCKDAEVIGNVIGNPELLTVDEAIRQFSIVHGLNKRTKLANDLERYNLWRRGAEDIEQPNPTELGILIDEVVKELRE